jgi:hypothetical protein
MDTVDAEFVRWLDALQRRHLANLNFSEVRRAAQALSRLYVERRESIDSGAVFGGAGKRAAFALYFGPLHFLLVRKIVGALGARVPNGMPILDLGCGTGVAGIAWALESEPRPRLVGIDRNGWAIQECRWTYEQFGIAGTVKPADLETLRIPANTAIIAAFTINELSPQARERLRRDLIEAARNGAPVLIVEPIARHFMMWWEEWSKDWKAAGGREDEWRFRLDLPESLALMDKAAGLDHRELTGRSLWLAGRP